MKVPVSFLRLVSLILVCMLLSSVAMADTMDLSGLTDSEVIELLEKVNAEIVNRGINKTANLPKGAYIAGRDLPTGRYVFTCRAKGNEWGNFTIYSDKGEGELLVWEVLSAPKEGEEPDTLFITLNDGDKMESAVPFSLTVMNGIRFQ